MILTDRLYKAAVLTCLSLSTFGATFAIRNPATSYELSVYHGTPVEFWGCLVLALALSIPTAVSRAVEGRSTRAILAVTAYPILLVVGLPLLRNYYFIGEADMLSHLGSTQELLTGVIEPTDLFYPATHTLAAVIQMTTGLSTRQSLMLLPPIFVLAFVVFVPLAARKLHTGRGAATFGVLVALMLIPINQSTIHLEPSPRNFALFVTPFALYTTYHAAVTTDVRTRVHVLLSYVAILLLHPMYGVGLTVLLGPLALILWGFKYTVSEEPTRQWSVLRNGFVIGVLTWVWISQREVFASVFGGFLYYAVEGAQTAGEVSQRGSSLAQLGGSLGELFVKLFLVTLIVSVIAAVFVLGRVVALLRTKRLREESPLNESLLLGSAFATLPLGALLPLFMLTDRTTLFFRYAAFLLVVGTVVAALGTRHYTIERLPKPVSKSIVPAGLLVLLLMSVLVLHPSPYIYQDTEHVTERDMASYETVFDHGNPGYSYDHVRSDVSRYGSALKGPSERSRRDYFHEGRRRGGIPDGFASRNLPGHYPGPTYVILSSADRQRELELYDGFRFDAADFEYLGSDSDIDKFHSSGGFSAYLVEAEDDEQAVEQAS